MSGTKKTYNFESKNFFEFFNIEEKFGISTRSLNSHYKKIVGILSKDNSFISQDRLSFAGRAYNTLLNPIERARYIIQLHGVDADYHDSMSPEDMHVCHEYRSELSYLTSEEEIEIFQQSLKEQSDFIVDNIQKSIDTNKDYEVASGLVSRFYELQEIYHDSKEKKSKIRDGIMFVKF
jgi:molecular chaperone HscB